MKIKPNIVEKAGYEKEGELLSKILDILSTVTQFKALDKARKALQPLGMGLTIHDDSAVISGRDGGEFKNQWVSFKVYRKPTNCQELFDEFKKELERYSPPTEIRVYSYKLADFIEEQLNGEMKVGEFKEKKEKLAALLERAAKIVRGVDKNGGDFDLD